MFWSLKHSGTVNSKLKDRGFQATRLSTYDFSILYTTIPHNLIKNNFLNLIEQTFSYIREDKLCLACNKRKRFSPLQTIIENKINRKAVNRNWSNQKAYPALNTKAGNKLKLQIDKIQ